MDWEESQHAGVTDLRLQCRCGRLRLEQELSWALAGWPCTPAASVTHEQAASSRHCRETVVRQRPALTWTARLRHGLDCTRAPSHR